MIVSGGSGGVVSFWSIRNTMQVCMCVTAVRIGNLVE